MINRSLKWRVPAIAAVLAGCFLLATPPFDPDGDGPAKGKLKLGLDLQGGMHLVLRVKTEALPADQRDDATERAIEVIRNRIDEFGVSEPSIQRQGKEQIVVQLPGISDRDRALALIGRTALLEFKIVSEEELLPDEEDGIPQIPPGTQIYKQKEGADLLIEDAAILDGKNLVDATVQYSSDWNEPVVAITFDSKGARAFANITSQNVGRRLAILLDDVIQSAPVINEPILGGEAQITGSFRLEEANDLAIALRAGALPAPIEVAEERTVGPTLGRDSVNKGVKATLFAGALTLVFMVIYYLGCGLIAASALLFNILIIAAWLSYFNATLTLPGIAGIILTIGMAVDTNVLILERIREELKVGKNAVAAVTAGYQKAFSAIMDSNLTTFVTALILFRFGTGPIRGFALTLAIGIVGSFFTGVFVTRAIMELSLHFGKFKRLMMMDFLRSTPHISFMKFSKICSLISGIVVIAVIAGSFFMSERHYGVDFSGGVLQEFRFRDAVQVEALRDALGNVGLQTAVIQRFGQDNEMVIRTPQGSEEAVREAMEGFSSGNPYEIVRVEAVGPIIGRELKKKALMAIVFSLIFILAYLAYRFEFRYSLGAMLALLHDAAICFGAIVLTGREVSIPVLAAILTIVGYSVNDTIVIFDRIREHLRRGKIKTGLESVMNQSINETLSRTLLTALTTLVVVVILFSFGGPVINDFAFTMIVGVIVGTYSSIYIACPVALYGSKRRLSRL